MASRGKFTKPTRCLNDFKNIGLRDFMNIWVDICHTPHVLLMAPLIREFEKRGHCVFITARNCFQICELLDLRGFKYQIIGKHYGGNKFLKIYGIFERTLQLAGFARKYRFQLGFSSGSPYHALAAFLLRIPYVVINDYEHSSVFNLIRYITHRLLFPVYISDEVLEKRGIASKKVIKFPGLKEDIYLADFKPDRNVLKLLNTNAERKIIVILRPAASEAHYHNPKSERLMQHILEHFKKKPNLIIVVVPRGPRQKEQFLKYKSADKELRKKMIIPEKAIDTLSLTYFADLMVGGGGTMNREAAAMGIPTYSFFCGPTGEVDRYLQKSGKLHFINSEKDILKIKLRKNSANNYKCNHELKQFVVQKILESLIK